MVPDDIVGLFQTGAFRGGDKTVKGGHELTDTGIGVHTADPVIPAGDNAQQPALIGTVCGDGYGGMPVAGFQVQHIPERGVRGEVGVAGNKARLVALYPRHHCRLVLNGLGTENEGQPPLLRQCDCQRVVGHGLHNGGYHGNTQGKRTRLLILAVLHQRRVQGHVVGDALRGGVAGHKEVLTEGMGRFGIVVSHSAFSPFFLVGRCLFMISPHGITAGRICKEEIFHTP